MSGAVFQRSKHNKENPYAQLSRTLLRDQSISFECRGLLAYLLSMADGWVIHARQLIEHCKGHYGRDKVYSIIDEAMEAGYIEREEFYEGNLRRTRYNISEEPIFKKSLRCPEKPDAGETDAVKADDKERTSNKENEEKENKNIAQTSPQADMASPSASRIRFAFNVYRFENIEIEHIHRWKELYPTVDIDLELKKMTEWILCNERKARSKKRWHQFISNWLSKNNEHNINKEAARSRGFSNEIDRRPRDKDGNVKPSQYAGMF
jgi:hypothetical protein